MTRYKRDNWTRKLIDDAVTFMKNKKHIDHYTMQLLTGYDIFNYYIKRINKKIPSNTGNVKQIPTMRSMHCSNAQDG